MQQLTKSEEQLMEQLWTLEKAFMKDLLEALPKPKPKTTTVATLLKRMIDKDFVGYNEFGNSREYYPLVKKTDYFNCLPGQATCRIPGGTHTWFGDL